MSPRFQSIDPVADVLTLTTFTVYSPAVIRYRHVCKWRCFSVYTVIISGNSNPVMWIQLRSILRKYLETACFYKTSWLIYQYCQITWLTHFNELTETWKGVQKRYAFASRTLLYLFSLGKTSEDKLSIKRDKPERRKEEKSPTASLHELPQEDVGFESYNLLLLKIYQITKKKNKFKRRPDLI